MLRLLLVAALLVSLCAAEDPSDPSFLLNRIYRTYTEATESPCVRLLNSTSHIGCGAAFPVRAPLELVQNEAGLLHFLESTEKEMSAVIMPASFFTRDNVNQLATSKRLAGILVAYYASAPSQGWSPADQNPNQRFGLRPDQFFAWNPQGTSWSFENQPCPIYFLSNETSTTLLALAASQSATYPKWVVEFNSEMWATQNTQLCLERGFCLPVGGQSPWATLGPLDASKNVIMAVSGLDANAFFHGNAKGAVSTVSSAAALLGAFIALGQVPNERVLSWPMQVVFAFFQGEEWGYIGSKRFVMETQSFVCRSGEQENACADPYKSSLAFTNIKFEKIRYLIEAKQVGSQQSDGLYLHTEKQPGSAELLRALNGAGVATKTPDSRNPGIPPSSSHAFLEANPDIQAVVIADHSAAYVNPYYDSDYDLVGNVNADLVCDAARLIVSSVLTLVADDPNSAPVNCSLVAALVECLASNLSCEAALPWTGYNFPIPLSNYVGVFQWTNSWTMTTDFVWRVLNATKPVNGTVNLHDALSPAFEYDENSQLWRIIDATESTWTESFWNVLTIRVFLQESWASDVIVLLSGILATVACTLALLYMRKTLGFESLAPAR